MIRFRACTLPRPAFLYRRTFHSSQSVCVGTLTVFRTPSPSLSSSDGGSSASKFDGSPNVEFRIRQQFTAPPGGAIDVDATGSFVWPTALPLLERIQTDFFLLDDSRKTTKRERRLRVLELGAGCGLLGMGLAATGCVDVVLTDHSRAIAWLQGNVEINRELLGGCATVAPLGWGDQEESAQLEAQQPRPFDLIVGSDIVYDQSKHAELVETMKYFSVAGNAPVYIAYPKRRDEEPFLSLAKEHFSSVEVEPLQTAAKADTENSLAILSSPVVGGTPKIQETSW
jgi:predicted nicotinamide N-methyase